MAELRSRRSERLQAARDKEEEERKESAVSDNDAEDADEDSEDPGSYRDTQSCGIADAQRSPRDCSPPRTAAVL